MVNVSTDNHLFFPDISLVIPKMLFYYFYTIKKWHFLSSICNSQFRVPYVKIDLKQHLLLCSSSNMDDEIISDQFETSCHSESEHSNDALLKLNLPRLFSILDGAL